MCRTEELTAQISDLTKQNKALETVIGQSEIDRTKLSTDSDQQLSELRVAVTDAVTENQAKSVKLKSLSATVESLTHELDACKVVQIFLVLYSTVLIAQLTKLVFRRELNTIRTAVYMHSEGERLPV